MTICRVGLAEALVDEVEVFEDGELITTLLEEDFDVDAELRTVLDESVDEGFAEELELTNVEDLELLKEVVETTLEALKFFDVDEDTGLLLLEAEVESKYISRRLPAPQYS